MFYDKPHIVKYLFYFMYTLSITLTIYYLNITKQSFNEYSLYKEDFKQKESEARRSPIKNIE